LVRISKNWYGSFKRKLSDKKKEKNNFRSGKKGKNLAEGAKGGKGNESKVHKVRQITGERKGMKIS